MTLCAGSSTCSLCQSGTYWSGLGDDMLPRLCSRLCTSFLTSLLCITLSSVFARVGHCVNFLLVVLFHSLLNRTFIALLDQYGCHTKLAFWQGLRAQEAVNNAFLVITRSQKVTSGGYIVSGGLNDEQADPNNSSKNSKCNV